MLLPKTIKVGYHDYKVRMVPSVMKRAKSGEKLIGQCDLMKQEIRVWEGVGPDNQMSTFWHEVLHAIAHNWDIDLTETDVSRLGCGLTTVLKDCGLLDAWYAANSGQLPDESIVQASSTAV